MLRLPGFAHKAPVMQATADDQACWQFIAADQEKRWLLYDL